MKEQKRLFHEFVKESPTYLNKELLSNIKEPCSIVLDFTKNPLLGSIRLGGFLLYKLKIEPLQDGALKEALTYGYKLSDGIIGNVFGTKIGELTKDEFQKIISDVNKKIIYEKVNETVPIKISDKANYEKPKNKENKQEENLNEILKKITEEDLNNKEFVEDLVEKFSQYECSRDFELDKLKKVPSRLIEIMQEYNFEQEELVNNNSIEF